MKRRAYVETSIPSFYFEVRPQPEMVARRAWTQAWWTKASGTTEMVTSLAVMEELERGDFAAREDCLTLIATLPVLAIEPPVLEIVEATIESCQPTQLEMHCILRSHPTTAATFS